MADVVNLNKFRKRKAAEEKRKRAEQNRKKHGRTSAERARDAAQRKAFEKRVEAARLQPHEDLVALLRDAPMVFIDCDGVIFDANRFKRHALEQAMAPHPPETHAPMREYWKAHGGDSRYVKLAHYIEAIVGLRGEAATRATEQAIATFARHSREGYTTVGPLPEAVEFARRIGPERPVVISGTEQGELRQVFVDKELTALFPQVLGSPTTKAEHLRNALTSARVSSDECVFIGDGGGDLKAADALQMPFVFLSEHSEWEQGAQAVAARPQGYLCATWRELLAAAPAPR